MKTSIRMRLIIGTVSLAVLASTVGFYAFQSNIKIADTFSAQKHSQQIITAATEAGSYAKRAEGHMMLYLTLGNTSDRDKYSQRYDSLVEQIDVMDKTIEDPQSRELLKGIKAQSDRLLATGTSLLASYDKSMGETGIFNFKDNEKSLRQLHDVTSSIRQQALDLTTYEIQLESSDKDAAVARLRMVNRNLTIIVSVFFIVALVIAHLISVSIWRPIRKLREGVSKVGQGDLSTAIDVHSKDEIGELAAAFNDMTVQLKQRLDERNQAEEALRSSEARFRVIFEQAHDGIMLVDSETGSIVDCNPEIERQTGRSFSELIRMKVWELSPMESVEDRRKLFVALQKQQEISSSETEYQKPDGTVCPVEFLSKALEIHDNKYVLILTRDLTERRKMQQQLIAQDRLVSIGQLVSGVAHEINNPLTSVIGFSELLMRNELPDNVKEDLEIICSEAKRCASIVKNLLIFARQQSQEKHLLDINEPVLSVLRLRERQQSVTNIIIDNHLVEGLPQVMASGSQLQQVFFNIIINAEQAMLAANQKGTLSISSQRRGDRVRVTFADNGPGIAREHLARVFSPFFTTKEPGKGIGLGLSISQGIVVEHGGKMWAESEPGKGAIFVVELPVYKGTDG